MDQKILVCLDGSKLSKAVCDYGIFISKTLDLPLVLLHVVEHSHIPSKLNLSGNLSLGIRDDLLEEFVSEEMSESKKLIQKGKAILQEFAVYAKENGVQKCEILQRHGALEDTLDALADTIKLGIIGLRGEEQNEIGSNVEELIRNLGIPMLLVNNDFIPIKSILIAYDGSEFAIKALNAIAKNPLFPENVKRFVVNANADAHASAKLLFEAKKLFDQKNLELTTQVLSGDPVQSILDFSEKNNIDIIAMGAYSHNRLKTKFFGSFTTKIFLKSPKPLLLFR
ncbi:MAG: universal stress protein [Sulfurospirillum sp.]|nr:universal stress protein [Sulfurospirillum sp.]